MKYVPKSFETSHWVDLLLPISKGIKGAWFKISFQSELRAFVDIAHPFHEVTWSHYDDYVSCPSRENLEQWCAEQTWAKPKNKGKLKRNPAERVATHGDILFRVATNGFRIAIYFVIAKKFDPWNLCNYTLHQGQQNFEETRSLR